MLCAIAGDDRLHDVVATARILAAPGALRPVFVHVAKPPRMAPVPVGFGVGARAAAAMLQYTSPTEAACVTDSALLEEADVWDDPTILTGGDPVRELARLAAEHDAAAIVAGTHGRGPVAGTLLGSVSRGLTRWGACPVVLVRAGALPGMDGPIVCAVDVEHRHHAATAWHAAKLASWTRRPLVLVHVLPMDHAASLAGPGFGAVWVEDDRRPRDDVQARLDGLAATLPAEDIECVVLPPSPIGARLDAFARGRRADLLITGSRGRGALWSALAGGVSSTLLHDASRPIAVVPPVD